MAFERQKLEMNGRGGFPQQSARHLTSTAAERSSPQKQSNTGTLYFDMTLYTNEFEADTSIAAEHTATKKDSDK